MEGKGLVTYVGECVVADEEEHHGGDLVEAEHNVSGDQAVDYGYCYHIKDEE